jgi:hypothetical protein
VEAATDRANTADEQIAQQNDELHSIKTERDDLQVLFVPSSTHLFRFTLFISLNRHNWKHHKQTKHR